MISPFMECDEKICLKGLHSYLENKGFFYFYFFSLGRNPEKKSNQPIQQKQMDTF